MIGGTLNVGEPMIVFLVDSGGSAAAPSVGRSPRGYAAQSTQRSTRDLVTISSAGSRITPPRPSVMVTAAVRNQSRSLSR